MIDNNYKYNLKIFAELDSTNDEAKRQIINALSIKDLNNTVIWAKKQINGRGRYDRNWISPEGNLYFSLIIVPEFSLAKIYQLSFVAALAVNLAISDFINEDVNLKCKWPNDILLEGKKVAGILLEKILDNAVIIGVGVNINSFPDNVIFSATSLNLHSKLPIKIDILLDKIVNNFNNILLRWQIYGFSVIGKAWLDMAYGIGSNIKVSLQDIVYTGTFMGINEDGQLILKEDSGNTRLISAGDVFF